MKGEKERRLVFRWRRMIRRETNREGNRWDRILGKQIKHPNGQILFSIEWMHRDDCCRVLDDAILHGSLNFSSLFRCHPRSRCIIPRRYGRFPLPSAAKRAPSFSSKRFTANNSPLERNNFSSPSSMIPFFLFPLDTNLPLDDDGKIGYVVDSFSGNTDETNISNFCLLIYGYGEW